MYLKQIRVVNDGPTRDIAMRFDTSSAVLTPVVFVGENGSGKTNLLSLIADALFEGASVHYTDVVQPSMGTGRYYFRVLGGSTIRRGTRGGFALMEFEHASQSLLYAEKAGVVATDELPDDLDDLLRSAATWTADETYKKFDLSTEVSKEIFSRGCFVFFPTGRSEAPHWLNRDSVVEQKFAVSESFTGQLGRALYVQSAIKEFSQWIAGVILDSRAELTYRSDEEGHSIDSSAFVGGKRVRSMATDLLRLVLDDETANFEWTGRHAGVRYRSSRTGGSLPLESLSAGQATLLGVFGSLLMRCDQAAEDVEILEVEGICLVDEIDAHIHIDLAHRAIPRLMKLFPRIQFFITAHSPLFVLGMENEYSTRDFNLIEMPLGISTSAEAYGEFEKALELVRRTHAFDQMLIEEVQRGLRPLVLLEGETDPQYFLHAAKVLGRESVLADVDVDWIGKRGALGSQGAGKSNLDHAWRTLSNNPQLSSRSIFFLYDNDANQRRETLGAITRMSIPSNAENNLLKNGVENLFPVVVFTEDLYDLSVIDNGSGSVIQKRTLAKARLCALLCSDDSNANIFAKFSPILDAIDDWRRGTVAPEGNQVSLEVEGG